MTPRAVLSVLSAFIPAFIFVLAGLAKTIDPYWLAAFLVTSFRLPATRAFFAARVVGLLEILVGVSLCALLGRSRAPAAIGVALSAFFGGLLTRLLLAKANLATCGCFGSLFNEFARTSLWWQVALDGFLAASLATHLWLSGAAPARGIRGGVTRTDEPS